MGVWGARRPRSSERRTWGLSEPSSGTEGVSSMGPRIRGAGACPRRSIAGRTRAKADDSRASRRSVFIARVVQSRTNVERRLERTVTDKWPRKTADFRTVAARTYYDRVLPDGAVAWEEFPGSVSLRTELSLRGMRFAARYGLVYERTDGAVPSIIFARSEDGGHGNFHPRAYEAICARPEWKRRLAKVHTAHKRMRVRADWKWMELDCANSSDALLMNVFCH